MLKIEKYYKAIRNRIIFTCYRGKFKEIGKKTLIESPFTIIGEECISLGDNIRVKPRSLLEAVKEHNGCFFNPSIKIGNDVSINYDVHIACADRVTIGDGTLLGSKVFITDHSHGNTQLDNLRIAPSDRKLEIKGPVMIGKNVWIGEGAVIMPGVTIGDNAIVGANSVVTHNVPPYCVVAGVPAKVMKSYGDKLIIWEQQ